MVFQMAPMPRTDTPTTLAVEVPAGGRILSGDLDLPASAGGLIVFAHGSGSSRHSPRNQFVARRFAERGFATLLIDLLTAKEEALDERTAEHRFDIRMLAARLASIIDWLRTRAATGRLPIGLFGASTGAGAALVAAAERRGDVAAVVSRGGRPDLAGEALLTVAAPTLLIVGGSDTAVIQMNRAAMRRMRTQVSLEIVPLASHLFEEQGALDRVAALAGDWFTRYLAPGGL
jgi:dienelactone hydrolase